MRAVEAIETVGLIQDAAIDPALWPSAVEHMMRQLDGIAGGLVVSDRRGGQALAAIGFDQPYVAQYFDHYGHLDPMLQAQPISAVGRAALSSTLLPEGAFLKSEFFNDWLAPQGFHDCFSAVVHRQGERQARLHIVPRRCADDSLARAMAMFKRLLPSIIGALRVAQRLELLHDRQAALQAALSAVAPAVMLVDRRAHVVFANPQAEALLVSSQALRVKGGRLTACHAATDAALQAALAQSLRNAGDAPPGVEDLAQPRPGQRPLAVSVVPVSRRVSDRFDPDRRVAAMILVADPQMRPSLRLEGFMQAYGLTPAEGRVLAAIVGGDRLERIAGRLGIGRATVKTHLNRILAKTGTMRQHALVRLVAASGLPSLGQRGILSD